MGPLAASYRAFFSHSVTRPDAYVKEVLGNGLRNQLTPCLSTVALVDLLHWRRIEVATLTLNVVPDARQCKLIC